MAGILDEKMRLVPDHVAKENQNGDQDGDSIGLRVRIDGGGNVAGQPVKRLVLDLGVLRIKRIIRLKGVAIPPTRLDSVAQIAPALLSAPGMVTPSSTRAPF